MASGFTPSIFDSSAEITNGFKLMRLIVDGGTEALRKTFKRFRGGNLQNVLSTFEHDLSPLKGSIIKKNQWDNLYPTPPNKPNINDFDITLMCILLRNICGLSLPDSSVWEKEPLDSDHSVEADIVRIRLFRNMRFGHIPNTAVRTTDFENYWAKLSLPLVRLGINQSEIDTLRSGSILDKQLICFDFQLEIKLYYEKYTQGTREWVFEQVFAWFHDESSNNRAFVITALAGMGKSVIAAVICNKFAEHIGACHFFQYSNSRYNNPNSLLQSVAWQVCNVIPAYKEALIEKLSGNLGQSLNNMNVEGLFSLLFKEPFSSVAGNGKRVLIVLDAVDESEHEGKQDLANLIANHFHKLPPNIRFLITTRPEKNLIEMFENLNPVFIKANEERNLKDIKTVLLESFSCVSFPTGNLIDTLAEKSDGLMLYAFFLSEICKDEPSMFSIDHFPKGVGKFYEKYFKRLEGEINSLGISEDTFLSFLSALAVAMEPLPQVFVGRLFRFDRTSPSTKREVAKVINSLSSLLVINENKSISFFHKSIRDWLVDNSDQHNYTVDEQCGHNILFDLCVDELNEIKKNDVKDITRASVALKYALNYYIPHLLNGAGNNGRLEIFVNNFVADLEVMFASVCLDVDLTLNNISSLMNHELYKHVSENTRTTVNELFFLVKRFAFLLRDCPQSFFQHVLNECEEELSGKASHLLKTHYKNIGYLELIEKKRKRDAVEFRCVLFGKISGIDVSPEKDYVVCSYEEGGIELFSLATGKSEWKIENFLVEHDLLFMLPHCIAFHPRENLILPGRLDSVLTLKGTFVKRELFQCGDNDVKFTNCCFSKDCTKLVTNYRLDLVVWNTLSGVKEIRLKCSSPLSSFSFTVSGKFLGTTSVDNVFTVYDVMNKYNEINSSTIQSQSSVVIVSTFEENCWYMLVNYRIGIINDDLSVSASYYFDVHNIAFPSNLYSCELECVLKQTKQNWFRQVRQYLNHTFGWSGYTALRYIEIGDKSVLVFSRNLNTMHCFSLKDLLGAREQGVDMKGVTCNISTDGNFVYLNNMRENKIIVHVVDSGKKSSMPCPQSNQFYLPVVRNGLILYGENRTPNLWKCDLTKCEVSFDELAGTEKCVFVSEEVIACICKSCIIFFDAVCRKIVHRVVFTENAKSVLACSIKYHVLVEINLWKDGEIVDGWMDIFCKHAGLTSIFLATFSPDGNRLALVSGETNKIFIFDVMSILFLSQVPIFGPENILTRVQFFDNVNLLCGSGRNHVLYLINVERGEILTCLDFGDIPAPLSVSRERSVVCAAHNCSENFELIKVWSPRTS